MNLAKHSKAKLVRIASSRVNNDILITVEDDGSGFDADQVVPAAKERKTLGIVTMQRRLEMLGGHIEFDSSLGRGTKVRLEIPIV